MKKRLREGAKLIVVDPRRIDLVRTPHVEAAYHLPLHARHQRRGADGDGACRSSPKGWSTRRSSASAATGTSSRNGRRSSPSRATRPKRSQQYTGVDPAETVRAAARLYATGGNAAIYYGLGVTEHSQGSTTVHGDRQPRDGDRQYRPAGRRREPAARPEQRAGRVRHGLVPARALRLPPHLRRRDARACSRRCGACRSTPSRACASPTCSMPRSTASFKALYIQGEDILQSDPDTHHVAAGLAAMECVVVQDLFLNETANYAHVFLPGSTFLEKDGTFTNAERRIQRVRKVMAPRNGGYADWEITQLHRQGDGLSTGTTRTPAEIMDEIARADADLRRRVASRSSTSWARCSGRATRPTPKARRSCTSTASRAARASSCSPSTCRPTSARARAIPLLLTTGRILIQYNVGAQTRRTDNVVWHEEDRLEIHPHDAEQRGIKDGDWVTLASRAGETALRALITDRVAPGVVYTTFHHPDDAGQRHHHRLSPTGRPTAPSTR